MFVTCVNLVYHKNSIVRSVKDVIRGSSVSDDEVYVHKLRRSLGSPKYDEENWNGRLIVDPEKLNLHACSSDNLLHLKQ